MFPYKHFVDYVLENIFKVIKDEEPYLSSCKQTSCPHHI